MQMKCKYCDAELAQWGGFCPVCGKDNRMDDTLPEEQVLEPETEEMQEIETEELAGQIEETDEPSPTLKKSKRIAAMSGCIALLAVLATVLFFGIRGGWEVDGLFDWLKPRPNTVLNKDSYTVSDKKAVSKADVVVATMGDLELTNAQLQIYYWSEVYSFLSENSDYLSYIGLDPSTPFSDQVCYFDQTMNWEQYFLDSALQVWRSNQALAEVAKKNGFQLPEDAQKELDNMEKDLTERAQKGGYESLEAMVQESFGPGVTFSDYKVYMEVYYLGYSYFEECYKAAEPTLEQLEAYYTANEQALIAEGIEKDGSYTVDVRHILVMIDNIAKEMDKEKAADEDKEEEEKYTELHWEACLAAAQKIYDEWQAGDKTEEHFGELANKHSHDKGGQVTDGGIYTFVKKGQMVEAFDAWCFDAARKPGDTGLVKTEYGYHVMYFVGSEETWLTKTRSHYMSSESNKIVSDALDQNPVEINYKKIVLGEIEL